MLPLEGDKKPFPFLRTDYNNRYRQLSPHGRSVAYVSDESSRDEIYVRTFSPESSVAASDDEGKWLISTGGGSEPRWSGDGKVQYLAPDRELMAVDIAASSDFQAGVPKALFQTPQSTSTVPYLWDLASDGKRFSSQR